jgi:hypothetical protein
MWVNFDLWIYPDVLFIFETSQLFFFLFPGVFGADVSDVRVQESEKRWGESAASHHPKTMSLQTSLNSNVD